MLNNGKWKMIFNVFENPDRFYCLKVRILDVKCLYSDLRLPFSVFCGIIKV